MQEIDGRKLRFLENFKRKIRFKIYQYHQDYRICKKCYGCINEGTCSEDLHCHKCENCKKFYRCKYIIKEMIYDGIICNILR
jgi:hypothetical protein